jgi:hypothetical protein
MKTTNVFLSILIGIIFLTSCQKNSTTPLPTITHTGNDMLAFKVNGNVVSMNNSFLSLITYYHANNDPVDIDGNMSSPLKCGVYLTFQCDTIGTYPISSIYPYGAGFVDNNNGTLTGNHQNTGFNTDSLHSGSVQVIYYTNSEIAGYFQFDAISNSGQIIHITEGRFDLYRN